MIGRAQLGNQEDCRDLTMHVVLIVCGVYLYMWDGIHWNFRTVPISCNFILLKR